MEETKVKLSKKLKELTSMPVSNEKKQVKKKVIKNKKNHYDVDS